MHHEYVDSETSMEMLFERRSKDLHHGRPKERLRKSNFQVSTLKIKKIKTEAIFFWSSMVALDTLRPLAV